MRTVFPTTAFGNQRNYWVPKALIELSRSQYCSFVRHAVVDTRHQSKWEESSVADLRLFVQDLAALLPACLSNFHGLASLRISGTIYDYYDYDSSSFPHDIRNMFTELIVTIFRYISLATLKELKLVLPVTYDFATLLANETASNTTLARLSIISVLRRLRRLYFGVCDNSGPGVDLTNSPSAIQTVFPIQDHAGKFFELIQLADRLESIAISANYGLDMDRLDSKHLHRLHAVVFRGVKISCSQFYPSRSRIMNHSKPYFFTKLNSKAVGGRICYSDFVGFRF
jgi:hypothetical protein